MLESVLQCIEQYIADNRTQHRLFNPLFVCFSYRDYVPTLVPVYFYVL